MRLRPVLLLKTLELNLVLWFVLLNEELESRTIRKILRLHYRFQLDPSIMHLRSGTFVEVTLLLKI